MINSLERPIAGAAGTFIEAAAGDEAAGPAGSPLASARDALTRLRRPEQAAQDTGFLPLGAGSNLISGLLGIVQQLVSMLGLGEQTSTPQEYFRSAGASSTGDPHLAFNGTDGAGNAENAKFDSMTGHADLLHSSSFAGGFGISTHVTQPGANGVTYNRDATITTNFGGTAVELDNAGNASIRQNGRTQNLAAGQNCDLGNGETVSRLQDGSLTIVDRNALGGNVTTRLTENGAGVDVNVQAQSVDLGGDLLQAAAPANRRLQGLAQ